MPSSLKAAVGPSPATTRSRGASATSAQSASRPAQSRLAQGRSTGSARPVPAFAAASEPLLKSVDVARSCAKSSPIASKEAPHSREPRPSTIVAAPRTPLDSPPIRRPGGGQPLPAHILDALQNSLGVDLSPVRLHTSTAWEKRARLLNARAFAFGPDIFLGPGESPADLALLAHETAHVLQQQAKTRIQTKSAVPGDTMEQEADQAAAAAQNQQLFAVKGRVSSPNVDQQNTGPTDRNHAGRPHAHDAKTKPGPGATIRIVERRNGAPLAEGQQHGQTAGRQDETAEKKEKEIPDREAAAQLRGNWAALPLEIPAASWVAIAFDAPASLELYPTPAPSGTDRATSQTDQNRIVREAVAEYSSFHRQAGSAHSQVVVKSNDTRRGIVEKGRDTLHHVDQLLNLALDGAGSAVAASRLMIDTGAHSALEALDRGEAAARVQLGGASAGAHKQIAAVAAKTAETIKKIEADLRRDFENLYSTNATAILESGNAAAGHLSSPDVDTGVQQSIQDSAEPIGAAEIEAERASVPRYLVDVAQAITTSYQAQVDALNQRISTKPPKGDSLEDVIQKFVESIKSAAIGDGSGGAPAPGAKANSGAPADAPGGASPAGSAPAKNKSEPLYTQANHAVDHAHSQAIGSLRSQVAAARKSIEAARRSAHQQCAAQRSAVFAQLTNVRQAHVTNIQHATANAARTVEDGARSAVTMYPDSCRSVARSLQDAARKGPRELEQMSRNGVVGARQSMDAAQSMQIRRLDQVGDDAREALSQQGGQAGEASAAIKESFSTAVHLIASSTATSMSDSVARQVQGFKGLSAGIAAAAKQFAQPLDKLFKKSIDDAKEKTFKPIFEGEQKSVEAATKESCTNFQNKSDQPLDAIQDRLDNVAKTLSDSLMRRAQKALGAWGIINLDEDALMASMRGVTEKQGKALEQMFLDQSGTRLRVRLKYEYDDWPGGLNEDEYNACINYLNGDTAKGALYELKTAKGWFSSDAKKAEDVMRSLTPSERADAVLSPEWGSVASDVRGGLSGDDLDVFDALAIGEVARADAIRLRQHVKEAKENNDKDALFKALENYHPGGDTDFLTTVRSDIAANQQATQASQLHEGALTAIPEHRQPAIGKTDQVSFADVQQEFAKIEPPAAPAPGQAAKTPAEVLAAYVLKPVEVEIPNGDGPPTTVTYTVEGPDAVLARTLAIEGPGTVNSKAARLYRESEKKGEKPDFEQLENAVVDPRLNKALPQGRGLDEAQRNQVRGEQDQVFLAYARLLKDNNLTTQEITDPNQARQFAAEQLKSHFDPKDTKEAIGAQYAASIVTQDVPDTVAALRYAQLGWGTDEDLIHRTFQRMSRADIENARVDYQKAYGSDLFADLGLYGKGTFGELSGDDRLQAEREAMGVPQNDREAAEVALFTNQQQKNETGWVGRHLVGGGEEAALERNEQRLRQMAGNKVETDELGRPKIPEESKSFDEKGRFIGGDSRAFSRELTMAQITAENYQASIDRLTTAITTAIAIIGAVVATVVTLGAGAPLLAAVLIAGATGLASMGASYAIKGGRYGWEQALTDLGMTGVQMLTAGVGASLGAAAKGGEALAEAAEAAEIAEEASTTAVKAVSEAPSFGQMVKTGAITGGIGGMGSAALDERTWKDGIGAGFGKVLMGGARGAFGGAIGAGVTGGLERIPLAGSVLGAVPGLLSSSGGVAGRAGELLFDAATGQFHGSMKDAIASLEEAGEQSLVQGALEGAAQTAFAKPHAEPGRPGHEVREAGERLREPMPPTQRLADEELHAPPALEHEAPPVHSALEKATGVPVLPAGEERPPAPLPPESEALSMPKEPFDTAGGGEDGKRPPGGGAPQPSSGGEPLFPNLTDEEIDALFGQAASGPMVEVRGAKTLDESLGLRLPTAQGGDYWGLDPAVGMTVQEYRFLSERGLPAVDSKGDQVPGPRGNKMTRMRIHSPDPTAPIGAASHEGWTMSFEQGEHLRMTADGVWFDRRYGSMPDGSELDIRPYRRGLAGDWVESSTGRPVTNPDHLAALDDWDRKMASSHIPLFPEAHHGSSPPSAPPAPSPVPRPGGAPEHAPPEQTPPQHTPEAETGEAERPGPYDKAAAGIADSRFAGDAAEKFNLPAAKSPDQAIENVVDLRSPVSKFAELKRENHRISHVELETRDTDRITGEPVKVQVRFEMVDSLPRENGIMPVAKYEPAGENQYVVRISKGAPEAVLERAIAHELIEIRAVHPEIRAGHRAVEVPEEHALTAQSHATKLTPHDEGRLAEMGVLANQLPKAKGAEREALLEDAQKLAEHLGLTGKGEAAEARRALAFEHLGDGRTQKWLKIAIEISEENPFKLKLERDLLPDLGTLSKRLKLAMKIGDLTLAEGAGELTPRMNLSTTDHPMVQDAVELIARMLISEGVIAFKPGSRSQAGYPRLSEDPEGRKSGQTEADRVRGQFGPEDGTERTLFDRAIKRASQPGARQLETGPSKGYEKTYSKEPTEETGLVLPKNIEIASGREQSRTLTVDSAAKERMALLAKAKVLDEQIDAATEKGDLKTAVTAREQRNALMKSAEDISEAFGMAAGLAYVQKNYPGAEKIFLETGPGVFDLVVKVNGDYVLIECKGGDSPFGSRWNYRGDKRVQQGTREYAIAIADDLRKPGKLSSVDVEMQKMGQELFDKLRSNPNYRPKYHVVRQGFDAAGRPTTPTVGEFDMRPNQPATPQAWGTAANKEPTEPKP